MSSISIGCTIEVTHKDGTVDKCPLHHNYTTEKGLDRLDYTKLIDNFNYIHIGSGTKIGTCELTCLLIEGGLDNNTDTATFPLFIVGDSITKIKNALGYSEYEDFGFEADSDNWPGIIPKKVIAPARGLASIKSMSTAEYRGVDCIVLVCTLDKSDVISSYLNLGITDTRQQKVGYCKLFYEEVDYIESPLHVVSTDSTVAETTATFTSTIGITTDCTFTELGWSNTDTITKWNPLFGRLTIGNPLTVDDPNFGLELIAGDKVTFNIKVTMRNIQQVGMYKSDTYPTETTQLLDVYQHIDLSDNAVGHTQLVYGSPVGMDAVQRPKMLYTPKDINLPTTAVKLLNRETLSHLAAKAATPLAAESVKFFDELYLATNTDGELLLYGYVKSKGTLEVKANTQDIDLDSLILLDASGEWTTETFNIPQKGETDYKGPELYKLIHTQTWDDNDAEIVTDSKGEQYYYNGNVSLVWINAHRTDERTGAGIRRVIPTVRGFDYAVYIDINKEPDYTLGGYPYYFENYDKDTNTFSLQTKEETIDALLDIDTGYGASGLLLYVYRYATVTYPYSVDNFGPFVSGFSNILDTDTTAVKRLLTNDLIYLIAPQYASTLVNVCLDVMNGKMPYDYGDPNAYILGIRPLLDDENRQMMLTVTEGDSSTMEPLYVTKYDDENQYQNATTFKDNIKIYKQYRVFHNKSIPIYKDVTDVDGNTEKQFLGRVAIIDITDAYYNNKGLPANVLAFSVQRNSTKWSVVFLPACYPQQHNEIKADGELVPAMRMPDAVQELIRDKLYLANEQTGYCQYSVPQADHKNVSANIFRAIASGSLIITQYNIYKLGYYTVLKGTQYWDKSFSTDCNEFGMKYLCKIKEDGSVYNMNVQNARFEYNSGVHTLTFELVPQSTADWDYFQYGGQKAQTSNNSIYTVSIQANDTDGINKVSIQINTDLMNGCVRYADRFYTQWKEMHNLVPWPYTKYEYPIKLGMYPLTIDKLYTTISVSEDWDTITDRVQAVVYYDLNDSNFGIGFYHVQQQPGYYKLYSKGGNVFLSFNHQAMYMADKPTFTINRLGSVTLPDGNDGTIKTTSFVLLTSSGYFVRMTTLMYSEHNKKQEDGSFTTEYSSAISDIKNFYGTAPLYTDQDWYWFGNGIGFLENDANSGRSRWHLYSAHKAAAIDIDYLASLEMTGDDTDIKHAIVSINKDSVEILRKSDIDTNTRIITEYKIADEFKHQHRFTPLRDFAKTVVSATQSKITSEDELQQISAVGNGVYVGITNDRTIALFSMQVDELKGSDEGKNFVVSSLVGVDLPNITTTLEDADILLLNDRYPITEIVTGFYLPDTETGYGVGAFNDKLIVFSSRDDNVDEDGYPSFAIEKYDDTNCTVLSFDTDSYGEIKYISCQGTLCTVISIKVEDSGSEPVSTIYASEYTIVKKTTEDEKTYMDFSTTTPTVTKLVAGQKNLVCGLATCGEYDVLLYLGGDVISDNIQPHGFYWNQDTLPSTKSTLASTRDFETALGLADNQSVLIELGSSICQTAEDTSAVIANIVLFTDGVKGEVSNRLLYFNIDMDAKQLTLYAPSVNTFKDIALSLNATLKDGFLYSVTDSSDGVFPGRYDCFGCAGKNGYINKAAVPNHVPITLKNLTKDSIHLPMDDSDNPLICPIVKKVQYTHRDGTPETYTVRAILGMSQRDDHVRIYTYLGNTRGTSFTFNTRRQFVPKYIGVTPNMYYHENNDITHGHKIQYKLSGIDDMSRPYNYNTIPINNTRVPIIIPLELNTLLRQHTTQELVPCNTADYVYDATTPLDTIRKLISSTTKEAIVVLGMRPDRYGVVDEITFKT